MAHIKLSQNSKCDRCQQIIRHGATAKTEWDPKTGHLRLICGRKDCQEPKTQQGQGEDR